MKDLLDLITENFAAVPKAPIPFFICLLVAGFVIYQVVKSLKAQEVADLTSRLDLKNDEVTDYKRKLEGRTPDEAKAAIESLTRRLAKLEPADLSEGQTKALVAAARLNPGLAVITQNMAAVRMGDLHTALIKAFAASGWSVSPTQAMGGPPQAAPIVVKMPNPLAMNAAQRAACEGLAAAGLEFHLVASPSWAPQPDGTLSDVEIYLGVG